MIFINANILDADFRLRKADLEIEDEKIVRLADKLSYTERDLIVDCAGYTNVPGFIDIHVHGGAGADTCDADEKGLREMAKFLLTKGVTSFCPTTMTVSNEEISRSLAAVRACMADKEGARIVGVNMEGPFISRAIMGAQGDEFIQAPDFDVFKSFYDECGGIIKPDVVLYEEGLDGDTISKSVSAIAKADVLIIGGTSLVVYPAAGLIDYYNGHKLVLINRDSTPRDGRADLIIRAPIGQVFSKAMELL